MTSVSNRARLIVVWGVALLLSIISLGISTYVVATTRIDWSCEVSGHGFKPRYDVKPVTTESIEAIKSLTWQQDRNEAWERSQANIYIYDVCSYCGTRSTR